jgi:ABC-type multidrug transport system fused ATPase/permease subunit
MNKLPEKVYEELIKLIDNSVIESIIKKVIITNDMTPEEVCFINILIENDKKNNFLRIKYIYLLEVSIKFSYFVDNVQDRRIFKIAVSALGVYNRTLFSKILRKYEKKSIIRLEKTFFNVFNMKIEDTINKNIELNNGEELINIQHTYLDSYKVIAAAYENYSSVIQHFFTFISEGILLFLRPLFFDTRYGFLKNTFNITFLSSYLIFVCFILFKKRSENMDRLDNGVYITDEILNFFNNLNIIVEKNKVKDELSKLLQKIVNVVSDPNFISAYELDKICKNHVDIMNKYKILETISSLIINDDYLFTLSGTVKNALAAFERKVYFARKKLKTSCELIDILKLKSYHVSNPIIWDQDKKYDYLFVLQNVTVEYKEYDKYFLVLMNVNLSFEFKRIHFIYGNSGCGKTTLINTMMKKLKIHNGSIKILNEYENYTYFSIRKYLAHLTSESILFPKSIYYNITFGMNEQLLNENKDEISQHIIKYMNILNMNSFVPDIKSKNSKKMSKGQTQRIAIIRLFINIIFDNIKIVFLDEFTSNIDNEMEIIIFNELLQLQSKFHLTIFLISHNMFNMKYSDFNYKFNVDERSITKYITKKDDILCVQ